MFIVFFMEEMKIVLIEFFWHSNKIVGDRKNGLPMFLARTSVVQGWFIKVTFSPVWMLTFCPVSCRILFNLYFFLQENQKVKIDDQLNVYTQL